MTNHIIVICYWYSTYAPFVANCAILNLKTCSKVPCSYTFVNIEEDRWMEDIGGWVGRLDR